MHLREVVEGTVVATLLGHTNRVWSVEFSPDGKRLLTASDDKSLKIWNVETALLRSTHWHSVGDVEEATYSPDHKSFAVIDDSGRLCQWNTTAWQPELAFQTRRETGNQPTTLANSPNGSSIAVLAVDGG